MQTDVKLEGKEEGGKKMAPRLTGSASLGLDYSESRTRAEKVRSFSAIERLRSL